MNAPRPYMGPTLKIGGALRRASEAGRADGKVRNELKELEEAAKQFEALLLHEMIKAMRKTVPEGGLTEQSFGRKIFTEMQDEQNSITMAKMGGIGLHRILVDQLSGGLSSVRDPGRDRMVHPLGGGDHRVSSSFGRRKHPIHGDHRMHAGMDMPAATGTAVSAARGGSVSFAGSLGGYGLMIELEHADGLTTRYAHLDRLDVKVGDEVRRGVRIGAVGETGTATGPHLHFEVRIDGEPSDPQDHLSGRTQR